ncbi:hypothetical protein RclHR1_21560003 [Rhizophagus clarus]|uniref:Crinkler effector protein N-terminal domain-containing protein n=1 Tax=Rhizophagus clarus TaxID=94130 RepID=A0A2Z6QTL9_9GLOM|nr:hypothetical protein RclHR1_21560003 [Rhizophagus clarus]GES83645.1 hypothetical protein GLOIN_2v1658885 [Rhizophagus clarus]
MSITLLCLVKGNTLANAFAVNIDRKKLVSHLKKVIKAERQNDFAGVNADKLRLWKVEIGSDYLDDPLKNLTLNDNNKLSVINEIGDYWTEKPPKKHIHVLVEPLALTATSTCEQELLDKLTALQTLHNKPVHEFDVIVSLKQKSYKWVVNIEHTTLEDLKTSIREMYQPPALENDGAVLNFMNDGGRYSPRNDVAF